MLLQEDGNAIESASKSIGKATQKVSDFGGKVSDLGGKVSDMSSTVTGFFTGSPAPDAPAAPIKSKPISVYVCVLCQVCFAAFITKPLHRSPIRIVCPCSSSQQHFRSYNQIKQAGQFIVGRPDAASA